jgi:mannose-6-phosphate isomerase class I
MAHKKIRWSKVYESSEEELVTFLQSRKLQTHRVAADEFTEQLQQVADHAFTIWCAEGSLTVRQDAKSTSVQPGDAITIDAADPYDLIAGMTGYVCYVSD